MQGKPHEGACVYWRGIGQFEWRFGYVTHVEGYDLIRMGTAVGDTHGGHVVSAEDIEWREKR